MFKSYTLELSLQITGAGPAAGGMATPVLAKVNWWKSTSNLNRAIWQSPTFQSYVAAPFYV